MQLNLCNQSPQFSRSILHLPAGPPLFGSNHSLAINHAGDNDDDSFGQLVLQSINSRMQLEPECLAVPPIVRESSSLVEALFKCHKSIILVTVTA